MGDPSTSRGDKACLFCRIVSGDIPARTVHETTTTLAFHDVNPQGPTHLLVVPRQHVASLHETTDPALLGQLLAAARDVAEQEGLATAGYRVVINTGGHGGQTVGHLHLHVLGGRPFSWPPG